MQNNLTIFENFQIRRHFDAEKQQWYFSVIDIIAVLTEQVNLDKANNYWRKLKQRLKEEGSEVVTNCHGFKMLSKDNKMRKTDVANIETIFRLIQSVPSKKAEPIKLWLAKIGNERVQEMSDPELALNRSREYWKQYGRSEKWIQQRMMSQETRNKLTDYWKNSGVKEGNEYAILTNIIHQEWAGLSIKQHKEKKQLKTENLRDHMNEAELIFTALAELSTRQIAESIDAKGLKANKIPAKKGGQIAKNARLELESKTSKKVISSENFLPKKPKDID